MILFKFIHCITSSLIVDVCQPHKNTLNKIAKSQILGHNSDINLQSQYWQPMAMFFQDNGQKCPYASLL